MCNPVSCFSAPMQTFLKDKPVVISTPSQNTGASQKSRRQGNCVTNHMASNTWGHDSDLPHLGQGGSKEANVQVGISFLLLHIVMLIPWLKPELSTFFLEQRHIGDLSNINILTGEAPDNADNSTSVNMSQIHLDDCAGAQVTWALQIYLLRTFTHLSLTMIPEAADFQQATSRISGFKTQFTLTISRLQRNL